MYSILEISNIINGKILHDNYNIIDNFSTNSKDITSNTIFIPIIGEKFNGNGFILDAIKNGVEACLIDKNYKNKLEVIKICKKKNISLIEVGDTVKSLGLIAKDNRKRNSNTMVIGITGSNGKTTTKEVLYNVLKDDYNVIKTEGNLNNHIGMPLTLLKLNNHDICILEMGMNHVGEIDYLTNIAQPDIAIITNIGTAHIGYLGSKDNILKAKLEIINGLRKNGLLIVNNEDEYLKDLKLDNINISKYGYNDIRNLKNIKNKTYYYIDNVKIKIKTAGEFDVLNSILAYKIGILFGIRSKKLKKLIYNSPIVKMRMETIKFKNNIIISDCYNANYDSMKNGIEYIIKKYKKNYHILLYLGDMLELGEWSEYYHRLIGKLINNNKIDVLYTTGNEIRYLNEEVINNSIIKKEFKINSDNIDLISNEIINDISKYDRSVVYFKASRSIGLDKIVDNILYKTKR